MPAELLPASIVQHFEYKDRLACGNLSAIGGDKRTVKIITNYG